MFLILTPENKEVCTKLLRCLDKKGWTFGRAKPIKDYKISISDNYIFLYKDKTIRIGSDIAFKYMSTKPPIITVNDTYRDYIPFEYDKWVEGFKKEIEKSILEGVYKYGESDI